MATRRFAIEKSFCVFRDFDLQKISLVSELSSPRVSSMSFARVSHRCDRNDREKRNDASQVLKKISRIRCITIVRTWTLYIIVLYFQLTEEESHTRESSSSGLPSGKSRVHRSMKFRIRFTVFSWRRRKKK